MSFDYSNFVSYSFTVIKYFDMETKEFNVIRTDKGLGNLKPAYIVEYDGKEQRVFMFNFQKERPAPKK